MRAITASFRLEILCLLAFQSPIGLERRSQPPPTNRIVHNESFHKWLLSSVRPHPDVISQLTILQDHVKHLGCQRAEQEPADGERIAGALSRNTSMKAFEHVVGGEIEDER
jgi:hypothetical protein